uniref:Uncharacterized protein n=1 Tax=Oreochromis niloticus TaxID=8128 RepID=A0A669E231_ORENI
MHPQGYATEAVPLQGVNYGGLPGQPGVVQHTAVNITRGQRVITESPKDHIIWSLCSFVYSNPFCLGLAALIYAIKEECRSESSEHGECRDTGAESTTLGLFGKKT